MLKTGRAGIYKRISLALSLVSVLTWIILGSGISVAWFSDAAPEIRNVFHFADFKLEVSYRAEDGAEWEDLEGATKVFNDEALYEPGYTQVVYLKVDNTGERAFTFKTAVSVTDYTVATNMYGQHFNLQDYLRFGIVAANTEEALSEALSTRQKAVALADQKLNNYSTDAAELAAGGTTYLALVVHMPESVENVANYRGSDIPKVELGLIVSASQITDS